MNTAIAGARDPVRMAHAMRLAGEDAVQTIALLFGLATLITPNLPEAEKLCGGEQGIASQAHSLMQRGAAHVLIKGGHAEGDGAVVNTWFAKEASRTWSWPRLPGAFHGSGCTLASSIAAWLTQGKTVEQAVELGQQYCHRALECAYSVAE